MDTYDLDLAGPALYQFDQFVIRPFIPPAHATTGMYTLSVQWVYLRVDIATEWRLGQLDHLTIRVDDLMSFLKGWMTKRRIEITSIERTLKSASEYESTLSTEASSQANHNAVDETFRLTSSDQGIGAFDEERLSYMAERLDALRRELSSVTAAYTRVYDAMAAGKPLPIPSHGFASEALSDDRIGPMPGTSVSTDRILDLRTPYGIRQFAFVEPVLGRQVAAIGCFRVLRHQGYRILGRQYLFSDYGEDARPQWLSGAGKPHFSLRCFLSNQRVVVLFEWWSEDNSSARLENVVSYIDRWLEKRRTKLDVSQQMRGTIRAGLENNGDSTSKTGDEYQEDDLYQTVLQARAELLNEML